ncbi:MAG: cysteine hydrolase [Mesorhizobium sp.]|uniref:cysteine hydrolase family protein n=1 Tax=unclassified Mesorhizobium TaxID=325217 RepID=UPI000FCAEAFD|nr:MULTISPECIES: isochorismatase family cysteine hydrolase [unclassified Mesorhizobium]RUV53460.1 cysteine hydrolase [Mesorhizobium sp. M5C.F.Ca.IN.020.29.1.1]RWE07512.1 MAG: cysteine hydrolase [Mesorhizobium sp.]TIM89723.1 MAG: isochorismatase family protein [Mesorhizobium sp.]TIX85772.1 MAG: isochorismatase family protein [Mesorhizobium sp.]
MAALGLVHGPLGENSLHLCVDMQRLFAPGGPWAVPWAQRVLPAIEELVDRHPERTLFTRFIPAARPGEGPGMWARHYRRWAEVTLANIDAGLVELMPSLARFVPPAKVLDKHVYSPWTEGRLNAMLTGSGIDTLVISGGETDVCILATVLGAIDHGFRTVLVTDAICSSADQTHDALMELYRSRFSEQVEAVRIEEVLENWR